MELKTARLTLLMDPNKKAAFELLCARQDRSASQVVRQLIREYLAQHGVEYTAADQAPAPAKPAKPAKPAPPARHAAPRAATPRARRR